MKPRAYFMFIFALCLCIFFSSCAPSQLLTPLQAYSKVLENKMRFLWDDELIDWKEYCETFERSDDSPEFDFIVIDLDADGIVETIFDTYPGIYLILHYENGVVYSLECGYKGMQCLKKDGSFHWPGGAGYGGYGKLHISEGNFETIDLAVYEWKPPEEETYQVNWAAVSYEEFEAYQEAQDKKEDVVWLDLRDDLPYLAQLEGYLHADS